MGNNAEDLLLIYTWGDKFWTGATLGMVSQLKQSSNIGGPQVPSSL